MRIASKPFTLPADLIHQIKFISPNIYELNAISTHIGFPSFVDDETSVEHLFQTDQDLLAKIKEASREVAQKVDNILITLGSHGVLVVNKTPSSRMKIFNNKLQYNKAAIDDKLNYRFYEIEKMTNIVNVSGAGDSFNVGFITSMINGFNEEICMSVGFESAKTALTSSSAVPHQYFGNDHPCWKRAAVYKSI